jgi:hypothetical protein
MTEPTTAETAKTRDYSQYLQKAPSHLHVDFAKYITTKTGFEGVDPKVIQLALALHGEYQSSDERKAAREQEAAERKAAQEAAKATKKGGPRSPEARELKQLKEAAATLEKLNQPVPSKTTKRIAELEAELAKLAGHVEVPAQADAPVEQPETVDA